MAETPVPRSAPFLSDIPAGDALAAWLEGVTRVDAVEAALADAPGRVTAAPVWALRSSPAYDASAMDGIAVRASDTVGATETSPRTLARYTVVDTGDALPDGCDAVVMREHVHWADGVPEVRAAAAPWQHVRTIGEDVSATELLLPEGHRLRPVDVAAAGAAGHVALAVRRAPHVVIIPTGDEVRPLGHDPAPGELVDTNSLMLGAQAREVGCTVESLPVLPDDSARIGAAVADAAGRADLVIVIAGSSAGRDDYTAEVIGRVGELLVHGVAVRPGHPVVLGRVGGHRGAGRAGISRLRRADLRDLRSPAPRRARGCCAGRAAACPRPAGAAAGLLARRRRLDPRPARPCRRRARRDAAPRGAGVLTSLVRADGLLVVPAALEGHDAGTEVEVRLLRDLDAVERTIVAIGSHDPVLDLAASLLRARNPLQTLVSGTVGSLSGLVALRDGLCHFSGCHLLDPESGRYTLPWIERVMPGQAVEVIRLVHREQGLIVAAGNPLGIDGLDDLPRLRYVNRQRGAGTRVLLDHELGKAGVDPASVAGYEREEPTHLAVAAAVAAGRADAGLGVMAAARAFGLDFVPVAREPFDLVMRPGEPAVLPLLALMQDHDFHAQVEAMGGYSTTETGRQIA